LPRGILDKLARFGTGSLLTFFSAIFLFGLAGCVTDRLARRNRLKLWLHPSVTDARLNRVWPPGETDPTSKNELAMLLDLQNTIWIAISGLMLLGMETGIPIIQLLLSLTVFVAAYVGLRWNRAKWNAIATSPAECWPPDELAAFADDPLQ
jgi:hypothetical protein